MEHVCQWHALARITEDKMSLGIWKYKLIFPITPDTGNYFWNSSEGLAVHWLCNYYKLSFNIENIFWKRLGIF